LSQANDPYRRIELIDLFFAVIIGIGIGRNLIDEILLAKAYRVLSFEIGPIFDILFFIVTFFWVVAYWAIYHKAIKSSGGYIGWGKFFVDLVGFAFMGIILNTSFIASDFLPEIDEGEDFDSADGNADFAIFPWFISSIIFWHSLVCLWHLLDFKRNPYRLLVDICDAISAHVARIMIFVVILVSFLVLEQTSSVMSMSIADCYDATQTTFRSANLDHITQSPQCYASYVVMAAAVLSMFILTFRRLKDFIIDEKDEKAAKKECKLSQVCQKLLDKANRSK
jgi:hypothetical protein